jgi:FkbM family methyltransferase
MPKSAYRVLYRVGRRVANGRLYGTSTYKGIRAFLRRKLVEDEVVETNGFKMVVDRDLSAFDPTMVGTGKAIWEPEMVEFLSKIIKPGWTVMDLGAESGYFALLMSQLVGSSGHVYAFEADPVSIARIKKSVEINRFSNITVVGKAVSDQPGTATFYPDGMRGALGYHRFGNQDGITVECASVDSVIPPDANVSFFKMDIEGSEWKALRGMQRTLKSCNSLITEFLTPGLRRTGGEPWDYLKQLADAGFTKIFDVDAMRVTSAAELKDRYKGLTPREEAQLILNLYCWRAEHTECVPPGA